MTRLTLDKANKKILGVCAGLANWTGIDAMIIRLIFAVATVVGFSSTGLNCKKEKDRNSNANQVRITFFHFLRVRVSRS
jgi:phage shock protein C